MSDLKRELLEELETELKEKESIGEISIFTAEELNAPTDILRAEITEFGPDLVSVLAEFFFIPIEDEETLYFTTVISIVLSMPPEAAPDIASTVARLNYYLPCGCYCLGNNDENLVYRLTLPLKADDDMEKQSADIYLSVNTAMEVAERYVGNLLLIKNNELSVKEMLDMLNNTGAE